MTAPAGSVVGPDGATASNRRSWWWRAGAVAVLAVAVASVAAAAAGDAGARAALRDARASLARTQHRTARADQLLAAARASVWRTTAGRNLLQYSAAVTFQSIGSAEQDLAGTTGSSYLTALNVKSLQGCLTGVSQAYVKLGASDLSAAVHALTGASGACRSLQSAGAGLVYPFDFPDPFVLRVGATYYAYATNSAAGNVQIIESTDLRDWTVVGDALPHLPAWSAAGATWAPSVLQVGSKFVMYYTAVDAPTGEECVSEAVATSPTGPFTDTSTAPLVCQVQLGGSIDPSPFIDTAGHPYLVWKSQGGGQPPGLWDQPLGPQGTAFLPASTPTRLLGPTQPWEGGVVEGPTMVWGGRSYFLFYSANSWSSAGYAVGVAVCAGPTGPCTKPRSQPILASQPGLLGPGGEAVFTDTAGQPWMAVHGYLPGAVGFPNSRDLFLRRLALVDGVPAVEPGGSPVGAPG